MRYSWVAGIGLVLGLGVSHAQTPNQLLEQCKSAYSSLRTYEGTTTVVTKMQVAGAPQTIKATAEIKYSKADGLRVEGDSVFKGRYGYLQNKAGVWQQEPGGKKWVSVPNIRDAIARATGVSGTAGAAVPCLLIGARYGNPFSARMQAVGNVSQEQVAGKTALKAVYTDSVSKLTIWFDPSTKLMVKMAKVVDTSKLMPRPGGQKVNRASNGSMTYEMTFANKGVNTAVPAGVFKNP